MRLNSRTIEQPTGSFLPLLFDMIAEWAASTQVSIGGRLMSIGVEFACWYIHIRANSNRFLFHALEHLQLLTQATYIAASRVMLGHIHRNAKNTLQGKGSGCAGNIRVVTVNANNPGAISSVVNTNPSVCPCCIPFPWRKNFASYADNSIAPWFFDDTLEPMYETILM